MNDIKTKAFVLRRTNYGEADRIINFITPQGNIAVIAKSVRKEKSKIAGNIELFCLSEITVHKSSTQPDGLGVLTGAKIIKNYPRIMTDLITLEFASKVLKQTSRVSENVDNPVFFEIVQQVFEALNQKTNPQLIEVWFNFQIASANGEAFNFHRDINGDKLQPDQNYCWDTTEQALRLDSKGRISANEIKLARLIMTNKLAVVARVRNLERILPALML